MPKYFLILFFCFFAAFLCPNISLGADYGSFEKIFYLSPAKETTGIASIKKNAENIDILAPQVYGVTTSLKVVGGLSKKLQKVVLDYKLKVMPLVANGGFNQKIMRDLLSSKEAQEKFAQFLVKEAKDKKFIGWQFDFENINYQDKDLYSQLVEKTAKELHKNNLILSVAAVSRTVDYEDTDAFLNWSGAFDYKRIANAVDFISLMTYDDSNSVGPSSSIPFVNSVLNYVKDKIPANKLSLGIPVYYWGWTTSPYARIRSGGSFQRIMNIRASTRHSLGFDAALGVSWLTYSYATQKYLLWFEDKKSFQLKLDIMEKNNFRGFSVWVLGDEDPAIWNILNNKS